MAKIAFIGAGSIVFSKNLLTDILSFPDLSGSTISLMDIEPGRLALTVRTANMVVAQEGFRAVIESTTDPDKALKGADYVITMFQQGGLTAFEKDIRIPETYGIYQSVGDTLGPGGVFRALRSVPVFLDICRRMESLCPDALLMNYVNPMAMNCWAVNKASAVKIVGLCHSVQGTAEDLAEYIGVPFHEVSYKCAGINHMCWFLDYRRKGEDCYPLIKAKYDDPAVYSKDVTRFEILKYFGHFVTESSYHMSEYVPYFRKSPEWREKIRNIDSYLKEDNGIYYKECERLASGFTEETERMLASERVSIERTEEYAAGIIHALESGTPAVVYGNVRNEGLIENLPLGAIVEVPCLVDAIGIQPTVIGRLPPQLAALNRSNINVQELAVEAALNGDRDLVYQAIMMDPLTSAVLTLPEIKKMTTEMFEAEKEFLPGF